MSYKVLSTHSSDLFPFEGTFEPLVFIRLDQFCQNRPWKFMPNRYILVRTVWMANWNTPPNRNRKAWFISGWLCIVSDYHFSPTPHYYYFLSFMGVDLYFASACRSLNFHMHVFKYISHAFAMFGVLKSCVYETVFEMWFRNVSKIWYFRKSIASRRWQYIF